MDEPTTINIESLRRIAESFFDGHPVLFAYLFGSLARGDSHAFSDIDIAVYIEGLDAEGRTRLSLNLSLDFEEKTGINTPCDIRVINDLPLTVKGEIVTQGKLIYSCSETERVEFEKNVRMAYFDFQPVIRRYHEAYLTGHSR